MADFTGDDLTGSRFERVNFSGSEFRAVNVLGDPAPWDPLDLPWDEMRDTPGVPRDRAVRPSLGTVLALRRDRMSTVRELVDGPVRECLLVVLNEEWEHRLYAERDLAVLEARRHKDADGRSLPA